MSLNVDIAASSSETSGDESATLLAAFEGAVVGGIVGICLVAAFWNCEEFRLPLLPLDFPPGWPLEGLSPSHSNSSLSKSLSLGRPALLQNEAAGSNKILGCSKDYMIQYSII